MSEYCTHGNSLRALKLMDNVWIKPANTFFCFFGIRAVLTVSYLYLTPEPLAGVRNLRVTDPTTSTLNVQWEAAEGNVRQYRIFYVPAAGGEEEMVIWKIGLKH